MTELIPNPGQKPAPDASNSDRVLVRNSHYTGNLAMKYVIF
jgi:hypothetical protein